MKKGFMKFTKLLVLAAMIISDLMTPISVLANEISDRDPVKGDVGINNKVSNNGDSVTVSKGSLTTDGDVLVTKTVSKTATDGEYEIKFRIEGKDVKETTTSTKPIYAVVVFDRSGSMYREKCNFLFFGCKEVKFSSAVDGARVFARTLINRFSNANLSLVAFDDNVNVLTNPNGDGFINGNFDSVRFGSPDGVTNLTGALNKARDLLDAKTGDYTKYVVVISDGAPTDSDGYATASAAKEAIAAAKLLKDENVNIFSIGYETDRTTSNTLRSISSGNGYYADADPETVAAKFSEITSNITSSTFAGTEAVLKDNIGDAFTVVPNDKISVDADGNVTANVGNITEGGTEISFIVKIKQDEADGWKNVNEGFSLSYKDSNDEEASLDYSSSEDQPQVYWERNTYSYTINYYRDSIEENNLLGSNNSNSAYKDVTITLSDSEKNAYLAAAGEGYEFNSEKSDSSLTISIDSSKNIINVVYTKKKLTYKVVYLFENNGSYTEISSVPSINGISATYGDNVNALTYNNITIPDGYTFNENMTKGNNNGIYSITDNDTVIRLYYDKIDVKYNVVYKFQNVDKTGYEDRPDLVNNIFNITTKYGTTISVDDYLISPTGFVLNRGMTYGDNNGKYVITDDNETIYIYYDRSNYKFNVNYHFNGEFDTTYNYSQDAIYGATEYAKNYTLDKVNNEHLTNKINNDNKNYFLDPDNNNGEIVIGDNEDNNILNVYYISTEFIPTDDGVIESITKNNNIREVISSSDKVTYTIKYNFNGKIENIKAGDKVVVTITDTLPGSINTERSNLNGGSYDGNKTITWVITEDIDEFTRLYEANNKEINITYSVLYNDYISNNGEVITNNVTGNTSVVRDNDIVIATDGVSDSSDVKVNIKGSVIATYKDTEGNTLTSNYTNNGLAGSEYTTPQKEIFGYTFKEVNGDDKEGIYVENKELVVNYVYTKNDGNIEDFDVKKEGSNIVESINGVFNYTITASTVITDYVGDATLIVTDILPYAIDKDNSTYDNRCTYNEENNTITCKVVYTDITENDYIDGIYSINEEFNLDLVFVSVDSDKVVNKATASIVLDNNKESDEDEKVIEVLKGTVIATYKDTDGNVLSNDVTTTGLVGSEYKTSSKDFFGYSLKEVKGSEVGTYTEDTIYVDYIYVKTIGEGDIEPPQTGVEGTNLYDYLLLIGMLVISLKGYKKIKRSL